MWEKTIEQLKTRDQEIQDAADEYQTFKNDANQKVSRLGLFWLFGDPNLRPQAIDVKQHLEFLSQEQENTKEANKKIVVLERQVAKVREEQILAAAQLQQFQDEVFVWMCRVCC